MKILFIDTETGGIDPLENSLLSLGLVCWENLKIKDKLEIFISKEKYNVTKKALEINKIDLDELRTKGISEKEAKNKLLNFLKENFEDEKIVLAGHNVNFDISFLKKIFESNDEFNQYFSYRAIDTATIFKFLSLRGDVTAEINSLDDAIKYYNIKIKKRHGALDDCLATAEIFTKMLKCRS